MSELKVKNETSKLYNFKILNNTINDTTKSKPLEKLAYYFLILFLFFFLFMFIIIIILLIRREILKFLEKLRRIKLQNEINKIMMIDIFETRSPTLESHNNEFHSINNDSSLSDISSSSGGSNVLSEINVHNEGNSSKESNDN